MATFQIDTPFLDSIKSLIKQGKNTLLRKKLKPIHYADIAEILETLSVEEATYIIKLLESETTADALSEVDPDTREQILDNLSIKEIAREVSELKTDDAGDQDDSMRPFDLFLPERQRVWQESQFVERNLDGLIIEDSHYRLLAIRSGHRRNAKIQPTIHHRRSNPSVLREPAFRNVEVGHDFQATGQRRMHFLRWIHRLVEDAINAQADFERLLSGLNVNV